MKRREYSTACWRPVPARRIYKASSIKLLATPNPNPDVCFVREFYRLKMMMMTRKQIHGMGVSSKTNRIIEYTYIHRPNYIQGMGLPI